MDPLLQASIYLLNCYNLFLNVFTTCIQRMGKVSFTLFVSSHPGGYLPWPGVPTLARSRWGVPTLARSRWGVPTLARSRWGGTYLGQVQMGGSTLVRSRQGVPILARGVVPQGR